MVEHRSWVAARSLSSASIHPRARLHHLGDAMRTIAALLLTALLTMSAGCAQKDWIDRTLVTVDVTGTWFGREQGTGSGASAFEVFLELQQQGSQVKGSIRSRSHGGNIRGDIDGTVAGDLLRFKSARGDVESELTVSGDEMTGRMSWAPSGSRPMLLRRVDPSSRPASLPR